MSTAAQQNQDHLEQFGNAISSLAAVEESGLFPAELLRVALPLTGIDAGMVYLRNGAGRFCCEAIRIETKRLELSADDLAEAGHLPAQPVEEVTGSLLSQVCREKRTLQYSVDGDSSSACPERDQFAEAFGYPADALLVVPLSDQDGTVRGVLHLLSASSDDFTSLVRKQAEQLAACGGRILQRLHQIEEQKALFESMIQMIAGAVDEKFYLGGDHCRRVPVVTMMLAQAVNRSELTPFAETCFDQRELYELEVAAWLHDCGKLVTPISLADKSTKLETVFDRIELIQTRFEIIRRDLEIARLRKGQQGSDLPVVSSATIRLQQMLEDLHFLAACNHGKKEMTPDDLQRLRLIAERYRWVDRQMEESSLLTEDELANLSIPSGTINEQERIKINNHSLATIGMLDLLPFPEELQRVPDIIGGYHQSGEAKPLLQARILAIADLFVSLVAENRSYRKSNTLDEAVEILQAMAAEKRLDPELVALFVADHIHQQYAAEFLSDEAIA